VLIAYYYAVRRQFADEFMGVSGLLFDAIAMCAGLLVYWYTAKAFGACFRENLPARVDYFHFVVAGEICLAIPHVLFLSVSRVVRTAVGDGSFETYLALPAPGCVTFSLLAAAQIPRECLRVAMMLLAAIFIFGLQIPLRELLLAAALQAVAWPVFLGLGFASAAGMIFCGRGAAAIGQASNLLMILAGAYFPISVFPEALATASRATSPFTLLLENTRALLGGAGFPWAGAGVLLSMGLAGLLGGALLFHASLRHVRRRGSPLLFSS
jgi:ABC-type uncharacterized transport system permease subunit